MTRENPMATHLSVAFCLCITLSVVPTVTSAECERTSSGGEVVGTLLGAGVLAGGLLGNKVGKSMDCRDIEYHNSTAQKSFETQRTGTTSEWANPDSGHSGTITPVQTFQRSDGVYCRDFQQTISVDGETELANGTACRQPDGTWKIGST